MKKRFPLHENKFSCGGKFIFTVWRGVKHFEVSEKIRSLTRVACVGKSPIFVSVNRYS